jgi:hypothetical protein
VRIRAEHAIGLLKGRFQALRELRIQIASHKRHEWAIFFIRCCIILHNLIIMLEGSDFNSTFRERLLAVAPIIPNIIDDTDSGGSDNELREVRRRVETAGQKFRRQVMTRLFNSVSSGAVRRPG